MFCRYCGKQIRDDSLFCPYCGKQICNPKKSGSLDYMSAVYALAYIPFLFWLPLVCKEKTQFGRQVANQGLLLLILSVSVNVVFAILGFVFGIGNIFLPLYIVIQVLSSICGLGILALIIIGIVFAAQKRLFRIPVIGDITLIS